MEALWTSTSAEVGKRRCTAILAPAYDDSRTIGKMGIGTYAVSGSVGRANSFVRDSGFWIMQAVEVSSILFLNRVSLLS